MKIVLTGATGFVGSHTAGALLARGHSVRAVFLPADSTARLEALAPHVERIPLDLNTASEKELLDLLAGCDACLHAAWYAVPGRYLVAIENLDCLNVTVRLLKAAGATGLKRFIGIGSCAEYDLSEGIISEETPLRPTTLYAAAKASCYMVGSQLANIFRYSFLWCRLFYLYGPWEAPGRLVSDLFASLIRGREVPVTHGRQERDFLHIADAAEALARAVESDLAGALNVGAGCGTTVRTVVESIAELTGNSRLICWGKRPENLLDPPRVIADNTRLREATGWAPKRSLAAGLRETYEWWKAHLP